MSGANAFTRKHTYSSYLVFFVLLVASVNASTELALPVEIDIPQYAEPTAISFPSALPLPDLAQISDNLELTPNIWMCGGVFSFDPPPQPLATLNRATKRYHHINALLGLNPYTTIHVLKFNKENKNVQKAAW